MGLHIDRITVEEMGPITDLDLTLGRFNVIYGGNEQGKTFLVEFLLRSLFKNLGGWQLRPPAGRGRVWVDGDDGGEPLVFRPDSQEKLEDVWADNRTGLPPRVCRLLVVKGADLEIDGGAPGGVGQTALREFLSGRSVLDAIQEPIQKTVRSASVVEGVIEGDHRGKLKERAEKREELAALDDLFAEADRLYSGGRRAALASQLEDVEGQIEAMVQARRHRAFTLDREIRDLDAELQRLPGEMLQDLKRDVQTYEEGMQSLQNKEERLAALAQDADDHDWLAQAMAVFQEREAQHGLSADERLLLSGGLLLLLSLVLGLLDVTVGMALAFVLGAALAGKYIYDLRRVARNARTLQELERLEAEFSRRFERPFSGLPLLKQMKEERHGAQVRASTLREQIEEERQRLDELRGKIARRMRELTGEASAPSDWRDTLAELTGRRAQLERDKQQLAADLQSLGVPASDYLAEPAGVSYSHEELINLEDRAETLRSDLEEEQQALQTLKQRICDRTGDDISMRWQPLLHQLQQKRAEVAQAYRDLTANILGRMVVCEVLEELRQEEDRKIEDSLRSATMSRPLKAVTGRYEGVRSDGDELFVADAFGEFPLSQLSTGAREQVLLALRLGVAAKLLGEETLFLILDDAFQYSDWQRRERLLQQMVQLAHRGWQITYFTMDVHLRELFEEAGQRHFGDRCTVHQL